MALFGSSLHFIPQTSDCCLSETSVLPLDSLIHSLLSIGHSASLYLSYLPLGDGITEPSLMNWHYHDHGAKFTGGFWRAVIEAAGVSAWRTVTTHAEMLISNQAYASATLWFAENPYKGLERAILLASLLRSTFYSTALLSPVNCEL